MIYKLLYIGILRLFSFKSQIVNISGKKNVFGSYGGLSEAGCQTLACALDIMVLHPRLTANSFIKVQKITKNPTSCQIVEKPAYWRNVNFCG